MQLSKSDFSRLINLLISGEIIDQHVYQDLYEQLQEHAVFEEINDYLDMMEKKCVATKDGYGFYCVYSRGLKDKNIKEQLKKQFIEIVTRMKVLNEWLRICRATQDNSRVMQCGDTISLGELLSQAEKSKLIQTQLRELVTKIGKGTTSTKDQIHSVLQYLQNNGYLHPIGATGTTYIATAKWSVFYDELDYICDLNGIAFDQDQEEAVQGDLI